MLFCPKTFESSDVSKCLLILTQDIGAKQETWVAMNGLYGIRPNKAQFQAQKIGGNFQVEAVAFAPPNNP